MNHSKGWWGGANLRFGPEVAHNNSKRDQQKKYVDHELVEKSDTVMVVSKVDEIATIPEPKISEALKNLEQQKEIK